MSIRLDFESGTVKQDLAMLPEKMLEAAYEELLQQAELMKGLAQVNVRVACMRVPFNILCQVLLR